MTIAIAVQVGLYLSLRHLATAYMPAWAHHQHHAVAGPLPWPSLVPADIVKGAGTDPALALPPALPAPMLSPAPIVVLPPPSLSGNGGVRPE